ncbi:peptidoglycan DD-metalloendopeptidase family protein [Patescibacteria group bacterium]|nr:peptidoglycan DD-metalloendopeptidase family protein [Patescibacteria group bacterium]
MAQNALFLLKKAGIKILVGLLNGLVHLKNLIVFILTWTVIKPLSWFSKTVLFSFAVKIYKFALFIKIRSWDKIYGPIKVKIIYPLTRRYVTHSIIALITLLSVASSLSAKAASLENAEQVGQKTILYALSYQGDYESLGYVQETADSTGITKTTNYLGSDLGTTSLASNLGTDDLVGELPIASVGDEGALLNPNLPSSINESTRTKVIEYQVEGGDSIGTIAEKFGISVNTVLWSNNLTSRSTIRPGDKLVILPTSGVLHKVKSGDTVDKIAKYYSSESEKILSFNALPDASDIKIGEYLVVPDGKVPPPAPIPQSTIASRNTVNIPSSSIVPTGGKLLWPNGCSRISQYFGWRHTGVDIACPAGTSIRAADDGVVTRVQYINTGYGHNVMIDHGGGVVTLYGHMTKIYVEPGETVKRGQEIGLEGSTGRSTGPHLHFEVRINGKFYNPLNYIK